MSQYKKQIKLNENRLYNIILKLSRNKLLYTKLELADTFQNRIYLIFFHISFLFIKIKQKDKSNFYINFYQKMFDCIFRRIEVNMREVGHGDMSVNKNMKFLVKVFYNILLNCEKYKNKNFTIKILGQPATKGMLDNNLWIYIERTTTRGKFVID